MPTIISMRFLMPLRSTMGLALLKSTAGFKWIRTLRCSCMDSKQLGTEFHPPPPIELNVGFIKENMPPCQCEID